MELAFRKSQAFSLLRKPNSDGLVQICSEKENKKNIKVFSLVDQLWQ